MSGFLVNGKLFGGFGENIPNKMVMYYNDPFVEDGMIVKWGSVCNHNGTKENLYSFISDEIYGSIMDDVSAKNAFEKAVKFIFRVKFKRDEQKEIKATT